MNETLKKFLFIGGVVAIAILVILVASSDKMGLKSGSTAIPAQQNAESSSISIFASESIATIGAFFLGGHNSDALSVAQYATVGTCADATSTIFALANPFSATSTAKLIALTGTNGTTTIDILVGTSTIPYVPVGQLASPTLANATTIATSTGFYTTSASRVGPDGSYVSPGSANFSEIVVGPSQYVLGEATSSYAGTSAVGLSGITGTLNTFGCTYKVLWTK